MYFPYFRGRQYELLALFELVEANRLGDQVIPIIEPVKPSSTFIKTLNAFVNNGRKLAVILNPQVGSFTKEIEDEKKNGIKSKYEELLKNRLIIKAHILNKKSQGQLELLEEQGFYKKDLLVICNNRDYLDLYSEIFSSTPRYTLIPDESIYRRKVRKKRVLLADKFAKQSRNIDYAEIDDEAFSDDHLYYSEDGYVGFSDYSIVGDNFFESGFAPYAVALHIVYLSEEDDSLRIKHFVSDSNDDITNPAGKFYEALEKLNDWDMAHEMDTLGLEGLLEHYENETYPGLGTVKKLSIMHHIELVGQYLDGVE